MESVIISQLSLLILPLLQCEVPPMRHCPSQTSPMWIHLMGCSTSQTAPAWVLFTRYDCSEINYSIMGSPKIHRSCQKTFFCKDSSSQSAFPARSLLQHGFSAGNRFLQGKLTLMGSPLVWNVDICSTVCSKGCKETIFFTTVFAESCRRNVCFDTWNISSHCVFTNLGVCTAPSHIFSLFFSPLSYCAVHFTCLKHVITEM